ncbi:GNAT family N-acetyltransferase [Alkalilacustris brevis]|uniref:GNAT family N-acetyltransferase n=1 Tax=Alkalilacustris brevis TaxID=2026338 RepID=UPI000E0D650D|nr:GNAT family N-acetyltransferase [Alkalilacustris brevis]
MPSLSMGRYRARFGTSAQDIDTARRLRHAAFIAARSGGAEGAAAGRDGDALDSRCRHVLVEEAATGALVCCFRVLDLPRGTAIGSSYSAQFYDLSRLGAYPGRILEIGRFCIDPARTDPDILRMAWAFLTRLVDAQGIELLIGCSSFEGTDPARYAAAFGLLRARHLAPPRWRPAGRAPERVRFDALPGADDPPDTRRALRELPPLLRSYLTLGGWVSDHAVIDRQLDTLHVFTGLEIRAIPPARARLMRAVARSGRAVVPVSP